MKRPRSGSLSVVVVASAAVSLSLSACSSPDKALEQANKGPSAAAQPAAPVDAGLPLDVPEAPPLPKLELAENDFVESDRNRDPFRSYASMFAPETTKKVAQTDRKIILPQLSLDELKLVAIVMSGDYPRAMVLDQNGKGWVIKRGDWIGKPDVVHIGGAGGADYQINWRVDRIREGDVVFIRQDPAQPAVPPATRVISLRPESEPDRLELLR